MKIIFMCKYNAFRSRIALSYFNKINKNKKINAISRGFILSEADKTQKRLAKKLGAEIKGKSKSISLDELKKADKIILVANDVPKIMFDYPKMDLKKKLTVWKIKDEQKQNIKKIEKIINKIKKRVEKLVKKLENAK